MSEPAQRWYHRLYVGIQYVLPQHLLSALMFRLTRVRWKPLKDLSIRLFVRQFGVDMAQAERTDPKAYPSFNAFFTRALLPGARPICERPDALACPADGSLSQFGTIDEGRIIQAKGLDYSVRDLLGGDAGWGERFAGGAFATIYLAPRDYHRVHMPLRGTLQRMLLVRGRLFSVNRITTSLVPRLFARNERVACLFEGEKGPFAMVLVGAIFVGSIETVWAGPVTPVRRASQPRPHRVDQPVRLARGEEMGRFNMGSTVILLFPPATVAWEESLRAGSHLRVGQSLGRAL
jgi:phosphatidylserine decarboxylase